MTRTILSMSIRIILTLLFFHSIANAQFSGKKQLRFNHLFLKDGLIEAQVYQIEQDNEGYMWFGTRMGIVRFDGYTPKTYQLETRKIARSNISAIYKDRKGGLWTAAAYEGLFYYDRANDTFIHCKADTLNEKRLQSSIIKRIQNDANGNLWLNLLNRTNYVVGDKDAYETVMLYNIKTHRFTNFSNTESGNQRVKYKQYLSPLETDNNGNIWCGSDSGLYKYDKKSNGFKPAFENSSYYHANIKQLAINPLKPELLWLVTNKQLLEYNTILKKVVLKFDSQSEAINQLLFDSQNQLWFAGSKGLHYFDDKTGTFINYKTVNIWQLEQDFSGGFWCETFNGLSYFDKKTKSFTHFSIEQDPNSLFGYPYLIFVDRNRILWISVIGAGIQWVNKQSSSIEKHNIPGNISYSLNDIAEADDSTFWLATGDGLYHWIPKKHSFINIISKTPYKGGFETILSGSKHNIWFGGYWGNNGVFCYNTITKKITNYKYNENDTNSVSAARIGDLLEDSKGNIWIGTWGGGLCMLDIKTKKIKRFPFIVNFEKTPNENKLDDKDALRVYQDKTGVLWIGTNAGSLNRFDEKTHSFISYQKTSNHFRGIVNIKEDNKNRLWVATSAKGLFLVDRKKETVKNISVKEGLLANFCGGILIDDSNNLWLNSARGISIYNPETGRVRALTNEIVQTNFPPFNSLKTKQGNFLFPVNNGIASIHPNDFKIDNTTPIVHIETLIYNKPQSKNKSIDSTIVRSEKNRIDLKYDENRITFTYVGLIYQNVEQVRYKYKLDGYDKGWMNANTRRSVTYNNLAPGAYIFHVTAANSDGIWSTKEDTIMIVISPPYWQTWWFRTLVVLVIAALISWAVKSYLNRKLRIQQQEFEKLKAIEKVRSKISMDIHDEISSGLTRISLLSQRVQNKFENNKEIEPDVIKKINHSSKEVITNLGEIIWAVNPKHDNLPSLLAYIRNYTFNFFDQTSIHLSINFPDETDAIVVSPDIKHNLFLVIKEGLNNIIKHSNASVVEFDFTCNKQSYQFTIKDNGNGIDDMNGRAFGNGFMNMKNRMAAIKGNIDFESEKNSGTSLVLKGQFY